MLKIISTSDGGYVSLIDYMGSDLSIVNAARVSYDRESNELSEADRRLIKRLAREGHTSPFRHAVMTFEVRAPLMVARQWWKHCVGSDHTMEAWNEVSHRWAKAEHRYAKMNWRGVTEDMKNILDTDLGDIIRASENAYSLAVAAGVPREQARAFLPANILLTGWRWTASLQAVAHFVSLRSGEGAQSEIKEYADAVAIMANGIYPCSFSALVGASEV